MSLKPVKKTDRWVPEDIILKSFDHYSDSTVAKKRLFLARAVPAVSTPLDLLTLGNALQGCYGYKGKR